MLESVLSNVFPTLEKELVKKMFEVGEFQTVPEGQIVVQPGENLRSSILVVDGLLKIFREDADGNEFFIYHIESGKACAISLICHQGKEISSVKAQAVKKTMLFCVPLVYVDDWLGKYKSWAHFAMSSYHDRFEDLLTTIDQVAFSNMDERLLHYLRLHVEKMNSRFIPLSFTQIATELNSSREVVSRLMKKLAEKGVIKLHRSNIEIVKL